MAWLTVEEEIRRSSCVKCLPKRRRVCGRFVCARCGRSTFAGLWGLRYFLSATHEEGEFSSQKEKRKEPFEKYQWKSQRDCHRWSLKLSEFGKPICFCWCKHKIKGDAIMPSRTSGVKGTPHTPSARD